MINRNKIVFQFIVATWVLVASIEYGINAQSNSGEKYGPSRSASTVIRKKGWIIPKAVFRTNAKKSSLQMQGINIESRVLTPVKAIVDYENFFIRSNQELVVLVDKRKIVAMSSLSVKGKVFAYAIRYTPYIDEISSVGSLFDVKFIDSDGDGLFEERLESIGMPILPDWVKK